MGWNKEKANRLAFARLVLAPFKAGEVDELRARWNLQESGSEDARPLNMIETFRLRSIDSEGEDREEINLILENLELEAQTLRYEFDCHSASELHKAILVDPKFLSACELAGVPPTRRQASKWRNGRRGAALRAAGVLR